MTNYLEYELGKATKILCEELFKLKPGETFIITADTESDMRVVNATATAAFACDAKPMVIITATPLGRGKSADPFFPSSLLPALLKADAWVEFNEQAILYSTVYDIAMRENKKLRHLCLIRANVELMVRNVGRIDYPNLEKFLRLVASKTLSAKHMRITNPAGTDVEFYNEPGRNVMCETGYAGTPGSHMAAGQIGWSPNLDSVNGTIVYDGSVAPLGLLKEPIRLTIKNGEVVHFEGGKEAVEYEHFLKNFNHPQMLRLAHACYGFGPGAKLTGITLEDERVWGNTSWGIGDVGPFLVPGGILGPSHSDGICLHSSVWLDGVQITHEGQVIDPELKDLAKKLGKA